LITPNSVCWIAANNLLVWPLE